LEAWSKKWK